MTLDNRLALAFSSGAHAIWNAEAPKTFAYAEASIYDVPRISSHTQLVAPFSQEVLLLSQKVKQKWNISLHGRNKLRQTNIYNSHKKEVSYPVKEHMYM